MKNMTLTYAIIENLDMYLLSFNHVKLIMTPKNFNTLHFICFSTIEKHILQEMWLVFLSYSRR